MFSNKYQLYSKETVSIPVHDIVNFFYATLDKDTNNTNSHCNRGDEKDEYTWAKTVA